jgi:hypothetical protein
LKNGFLPYEPGDYGIDENGVWWAHIPAPGFSIGNLSAHEVVEHEDGTITVSPSILMYGRNGGADWHGYLERGVWRTV